LAVGEAGDGEDAGVFYDGVGGVPVGVGAADFSVFDGGSVDEGETLVVEFGFDGGPPGGGGVFEAGPAFVPGG
jgi:hypothetical protein